MADLKISQFVDGGAVQQTDEIATNRGGVNTKVFVGSAAAYDVGMGSDDIPTNSLIPTTIANTLFGTSDTENTISTGSQSFTTQALKSFEVGRDLTIVDASNPTTNRMSGIVTSYDSETGDLTVDISSIYGSGTIDDWIIYVSGTSGENGNDGWSPVLAIISDGARRVFQVIDWVGGEGTKPDTGDYVGSTGLVTDIADGVDVRGPTGPAGDGGHASDIDYDNATSGLTATNVQGAIDEIVGDLDDYPTTTEMNTAIDLAKIQLQSSVATTSGTAIDFTGIPAGVNRVTLNLNGVSLSGSDNLLSQLGSGGAPKTSGYDAVGQTITNTVNTQVFTTGFGVRGAASTIVDYGKFVFEKVSGNTWTCFADIYDSTNDARRPVSGVVTLSGELDLVRLTSDGEDTFDAGTISISWEF